MFLSDGHIPQPFNGDGLFRGCHVIGGDSEYLKIACYPGRQVDVVVRDRGSRYWALLGSFHRLVF